MPSNDPRSNISLDFGEVGALDSDGPSTILGCRLSGELKSASSPSVEVCNPAVSILVLLDASNALLLLSNFSK